MKKVQFKELNPIAKRANAKAVAIGGKHYLIGRECLIQVGCPKQARSAMWSSWFWRCRPQTPFRSIGKRGK